MEHPKGEYTEYKIPFTRKFNDLIHELAVTEGISVADVVYRAVGYYGFFRKKLEENSDLQLILKNRITGEQKYIPFEKTVRSTTPP